VDALTAPFWEAASQGRLVIQRCQNCKRYHHPPLVVCTDCLSTDQRYEPVSGRGTISTFTITYDARQPAFEAIQPYTVAVVELAEQERLFMLSNIPGTPVEEIAIGLRVIVEFEEIAPGLKIPQFRVTG
jgi:uncharacterized OB-fold protein